MNKHICMAILIALVIAGFSALYDKNTHIIPGVSLTTTTEKIYQQTQQKRIVDYLQRYHKLPDYYITKHQARQQGWEPNKGNLCTVLPGKAIGGDRFSNREKQLPDAHHRKWYEADINYRCGRRGSDRLLYSNDGLIFVTLDHYRHFIKAE